MTRAAPDGAASLYAYILHFDVLIVVAPHCDARRRIEPGAHRRAIGIGSGLSELWWAQVATRGVRACIRAGDLYHLLTSSTLRAVLVLLLLPPLLMVTLSGTLSRLLLWPVLEPTWARILFVGRAERVHARWRAQGAVAACELAIAEMLPPHIQLRLPWQFGGWLVATVVLYATLRALFDLNAILYCNNLACDADLLRGDFSGFFHIIGRNAAGHFVSALAS